MLLVERWALRLVGRQNRYGVNVSHSRGCLSLTVSDIPSCDDTVNHLPPSGLMTMVTCVGTTGHSQWNMLRFQYYSLISKNLKCTGALILAEKQNLD